jgi:hypothetical protein
MPKWVLPLLILIGLYVLSVGPLVTYFSKSTGGKKMVPNWVRNYGEPYLWLYGRSPEPIQNISDGYFHWCEGMLLKSEEGIDTMKEQAAPRPPLPFGF